MIVWCILFVAKRLFSEYSMRQVRGVQFDGRIRFTYLTHVPINFCCIEWVG